MSRDCDIAWAAGLFEGEGSISYNPDAGRATKKVGKYGHLRLSMTDEDVVRRFAAIVAVGQVYHYPSYSPPTVNGLPRKPQWAWGTANRWSVRAVLTSFRPYLAERRGSLADEILDLSPPGEHKDTCAKGHSVSGDNLYVDPRTGWYKCRICRRDAVNRSSRRRRARVA